MENTTVELSDNHQRMTIAVSKEEYLAERKKALKKLQSTANIPGFRPGKAPESVVLKMYGQGLGFDETYQKVYSHFNQELKEKNLKLLLEPLAELAPEADFTTGEHLAFHFEYALEPDLELTTEDLHSEVLYRVYLTDEEFAQELENIKIRNKKTVPTDDFSQADGFRVLVHTSAHDDHQQSGHSHDHTVVVLKSDILPEKLDEFKSAFDQQNTEIRIAEFLVNPDDKKFSELTAAHHLHFDAMVRFEDPSMDELKDLIFGHSRKFDNEEELLSAIREQIEKYLNEDALRVYIQHIKTKAEAKINGIPKEFLEKWWSREEKNKEIKFESIYPQLEYEIKSNIISKAINKLLDIKISREQVRDYYVNQHLSSIDEEKREALKDLIIQIVENNLNDSRQSETMYDRVYEEALFEKIKSVKTNPFQVTFTQFKEILSNQK